MSLRFVVLAHDRPQALAELVEALHRTHPSAKVAVFNGGSDPSLTEGLDVEVLEESRPLRHGHLTAFHDAALQTARTTDWLVTLDSDVLPVRSGLLEHLISLDTDYAGAHLGEVLPGTAWRPGRRFLPEWPRWQPVVGLAHPWRCFNPVQAFSRRFVEAYLAWPHRSAVMGLAAASRVAALEEIVWPTVAASLGLRLHDLGGGDALRLRPPSPYELRGHLADRAVYVVHKVRTAPDALERRLVLAHLRGEPVDWDAAEHAAAREQRTPRQLAKRLRAAAAAHRP